MLFSLVLHTFRHLKGNLLIFVNYANPGSYNFTPILKNSREGKMVWNKGFPKSNSNLGINHELITLNTKINNKRI